ncbi:hypothetical protein Tco_0071755 [Tanacetum coccineum]
MTYFWGCYNEDEPSDDDEDEEVDIEADDEEEEEHPAHADSTDVALPAVDHASSAEETELFETDESAATPPPHPAYRITARISIRDETPISLPPREEISSPLLPVSSPVRVLSPSPLASPICPLGYQATMIRLRAKAASTSHSLPSPPPIILSHTRPDAASSGTPHLHLLSTDRRTDRPELMASRLNMLYRDRRAYTRTARLIEAEARIIVGSVYRATSSRPQEVGGDYRDAGSRSQEAEAIHRGSEAAEETSDLDDIVRETAGTR